jgi:2'-5' RNA ligase
VRRQLIAGHGFDEQLFDARLGIHQRAGATLIPDQLDLFAEDSPSAWFVPRRLVGGCQPYAYEVFFGIQPRFLDVSLRMRMMEELLGRYGSERAKPMLPPHLHVTLLGVATFDARLAYEVFDAAKAAAAGVSFQPFELAFDRFASFPNSDANMLRCSPASHRATVQLRRQLASRMKRFGLTRRAGSDPHLTIFHDPARRHAEVALEAPLVGQAADFALILSYQGCTVHETLGVWPLPR